MAFDDEILKKAQKYADLQAEINSGLKGYLEGIDKLGRLTKTINSTQSIINKLRKEENELLKSGLTVNDDEVKLIQTKIALLQKYNDKIKEEQQLLTEIVKNSKKWQMLGGQVLATTVKTAASLEKIPSFIGNITNKLKDLFEMDKAIRQAGLEMGLINKQSESFRKNIKDAASNTISFGAGIKELAQLQSQYSDNIGRNVSMGQKDLEALAEIARGTALGAESTAQMAADFEAQGISALRTKGFIQEAVDNSTALGLNTTKVMKNLSQNIKMLNRYRFKDGIKGLVKMSELSTKLGVSMEFATGMSEKLFNVEGAVEMSAQLQVMGGAFARLADPSKLMYMARNDMAGLVDELSKAAAESVNFNNKTGEFEIAAMEMHRLRIIAEQTGVSYDELTNAAKNAAKFSKLKTQISFDIDEKGREFLENTAKFDKHGRAFIEIGGEKKFLNQLGAAGKTLIEEQVAEKKSLKERAEAAQTFDESLTNLINMVKQYMMPIVEGITDVLKPLVQDFINNGSLKKDLKELGKNIGEFVKWGAKGVKWFVETVVDTFGPKGIFKAWLGAKGILLLFDVAKWFSNGLALSKGFLTGTGGMGRGFGARTPAGGYTRNGMPINTQPGTGGMGRGFGAPTPAGGYTRNGMPINTQPRMGMGGKLAMGTMGSVAAGAGLGIAGYGTDKLRDSIYGEGSEEGKGLGVASAALTGAGMGMMFGPWGAAIGALLGGGYGVYDEYFNKPQNDAKFAGFGSTHSNGRAIVQGGKITPIDNKDDVLAMKRGGVVDKMMMGKPANKVDGVTKIEFGELNITGEIKINLPGSSTIGLELTKNQEFKTSITRIVQSQIEKQINGGKNRG